MKLQTIASLFLLLAFGGSLAAQPAARPLKAVFLDNGRELSFRKGDGSELWRFKSPRGEFFRSRSHGASRVVKNGGFLVVDTTTTVYGIDAKNGKLKWSFDYPRPTDLVRLGNLMLTDEQVLLSTNQIGNPLICLDPTTGKKLWSYPDGGDEKLGFYELAVRDNQVLVRVAATRDSRRGYTYENRALNLKTGKSKAWPARYKKVPGGRGRLDHVFQGRELAPSKRDDRFFGVLRRKANGGEFHFHRPRFYAGAPYFAFVGDPAQLAKLVDKRVEIHGKVLSVAESAPPQYRIQVLSIKAAPAKPRKP